jgi:hypothetical protein
VTGRRKLVAVAAAGALAVEQPVDGAALRPGRRD